MKTNEQYLVLESPDWWLCDNLSEARNKAAELRIHPGDPGIVYKAFEEVDHTGKIETIT